MVNDLNSILKQFKVNRFAPKTDSETIIPDQAGNYIICLKSSSKLPKVSIDPIMKQFCGLKVLYTGIAKGSLRNRDYRQHFKGNNAGRSTLRKSLGVLFGYKLIQRDKDPSNGKTKFGLIDEKKLSDWMSQNLIMFFIASTNYAKIEILLINHFNPPLNLKDNHNRINSDFRKLLSNLRNKRTNIKFESHNVSIFKSEKKLIQTNKVNKVATPIYESKIIEAIDNKLLETGKQYMLLAQANKLLISHGLVENNKVLKQMLENNQIPNSQQTNTAPKQWRILLSKAGEKRINKIERINANEKKNAKRKTAKNTSELKRNLFKQEELSSSKIIFQIVAIFCWFGSCIELAKIGKTEFSITYIILTLLIGLIFYSKAKNRHSI